MSKNRTLYIIIPAFGAAIIAALSQIIIPIGAGAHHLTDLCCRTGGCHF